MAWQTDQPPLNYLKRRVIYYKKKRGTVKGLLKDKQIMKRYTKKDVMRAVDRIDARIKEFEKAIETLTLSMGI